MVRSPSVFPETPSGLCAPRSASCIQRIWETFHLASTKLIKTHSVLRVVLTEDASGHQAVKPAVKPAVWSVDQRNRMQASGLNRTAVSWVIVVVPGGEATQSSAHHLSTSATGRRRKAVFEVTPPIRPHSEGFSYRKI